MRIFVTGATGFVGSAIVHELLDAGQQVPIVSETSEEATEHFGWFAHFAALNVPASSNQTQQKLGWRLTQPGLIADIDRPSYFKASPKRGL